MIVCPNCNHQNPEGATQCEACYTPLPTTTTCPSCGATVQSDAAFCGQCGYNLQPATAAPLEEDPAAIPTVVSPPSAPVTPEPLVTPEPVVTSAVAPPNLEKSNPDPEPVGVRATTSPDLNSSPPTASVQTAGSPTTQLQHLSARLLHIQTNVTLELPPNLPVIHVGKPNDLVPPDLDVSGFPHSEIVSRTHADIRVEGDSYYIEDVGSSNGTYVNNIPLTKGNRHRLRPGDRVSLGKGDLVSFIFQHS
ncbi:FHA domain-containing protein [Capilliphycus salinus ALCB114379]|uniref:FHA domain-containing protein n=1 Tax=Capilliphycus salinus TaxID=2768948 RepID=UPI0039A73A44